MALCYYPEEILPFFFFSLGWERPRNRAWNEIRAVKRLYLGETSARIFGCRFCNDILSSIVRKLEPCTEVIFVAHLPSESRKGLVQLN